MQEFWKDVKGYEGLYQVSNLGNVRTVQHVTIRKNGVSLTVPAKELKPGIDSGGYKLVVLANGSSTRSMRIHRLVADAFVENPNPERFTFINHKDEDKLNNVYTNLEWCTNAYNLKYGTAMQRMAEKIRGRTLSKEHCMHISESLRGRVSPMKGRHQTESAKLKISKSMKAYRAKLHRISEQELTRMEGR